VRHYLLACLRNLPFHHQLIAASPAQRDRIHSSALLTGLHQLCTTVVVHSLSGNTSSRHRSAPCTTSAVNMLASLHQLTEAKAHVVISISLVLTCMCVRSRGVASTSAMLGLAAASLVSMRSTSAARSLECGGGTKGACCATILNTMPKRLFALKACFKQHISYKMQPRAQMSLLYEYGCACVV
jgi:hypothetical protein